MKGHKCMVLFCKSRGSVPGIKYFRLTTERRNAWLIALGRDPNIEQLSNTNRVCSLHFADEDLSTISNGLCLKPGAIPTKQLGIRKVFTPLQDVQPPEIPTFRSPSTHNEAQLKNEPIDDIEKIDVIVYEDWKIKQEEPDIKMELEEEGTSCGKLCSDVTEYPTQIVKSEAINESEESYDVKVEVSAMPCEVTIKEEVESDDISFPPYFVSQDSQVKCENYTQEGNDRFCDQTPRSILFQTLTTPKNGHCSRKTGQETSLNGAIQNPIPEEKKADFVKCQQCPYETNSQADLNKHSIRHKNPEEVDIFKCNKCDFQTIYKRSLHSHNFRHQDFIRFKCDQCSYQTNFRTHLKRHSRLHKKPEELDILKCNKCDFRTTSEYNFRTHRLQHNSSELKCDNCDFRTKFRDSLNSHLNRHIHTQHRNPEELDLVKCNEDDFQAKYKLFICGKKS